MSVCRLGHKVPNVDWSGGGAQLLMHVAAGLPFGGAVRAARWRMIETRRERNLIFVDLPSDQTRSISRAATMRTAQRVVSTG